MLFSISRSNAFSLIGKFGFRLWVSRFNWIFSTSYSEIPQTKSNGFKPFNQIVLQFFIGFKNYFVIKNEKTVGNWNYNKEFHQNSKEGQYNKTIDLTMDLKPLLSKEITNSNEDFQKGFLTLVPSFQNCITGRFYFIHLIVKFHNHVAASLKIPFIIQLWCI